MAGGPFVWHGDGEINDAGDFASVHGGSFAGGMEPMETGLSASVAGTDSPPPPPPPPPAEEALSGRLAEGKGDRQQGCDGGWELMRLRLQARLRALLKHFDGCVF